MYQWEGKRSEWWDRSKGQGGADNVALLLCDWWPLGHVLTLAKL